MPFYTYILSSRSRNAIYIGATRDLRRRVEQHRAEAVNAHTKRYHIHLLVYFETYTSLEDALLREKRLKRWHGDWKDQLVASVNPNWRDISSEIPY